MSQDPDRLTIPPDGGPESEQPRWRHDFPIDVPQDDYVARREFTKFMVLTSLAFAVGQVWILVQNAFRRTMGKPPAMRIAEAAGLPVGGAVTFHYPDHRRTCLLVRLGATRYVAYDQACTHLTCPVVPRPDENLLYCPCHNGAFDLHSGRPTMGPPRRPLVRVTLEVRGDGVYATGLEERTS